MCTPGVYAGTQQIHQSTRYLTAGPGNTESILPVIQ